MTAPEQQQRPLGPHPGVEPRANPAARWIATLLGLVLLGLAGLAGYDLWVHYSDTSRSQLLPRAWEFLGAQEITGVMVGVGIVIAIVGLILAIVAFMPRAKTHIRVASPVSIWVRPVDVARKATHTTRAEFGAGDIRSRADRSNLKVELNTEGDQAELAQQVTATLNQEFSRLATPPSVSVKTLGAQQTQQTQPTQGAEQQKEVK